MCLANDPLTLTHTARTSSKFNLLSLQSPLAKLKKTTELLGGLVVTSCYIITAQQKLALRFSLHRHSNPATRKAHSLSQSREVSTTRAQTEKNLDHKSLPKKKKKKLIIRIFFRDLLLLPLQSRRNRHANGHRRKLASLTDTRFLRPS
jgi:hypothetical protein